MVLRTRSFFNFDFSMMTYWFLVGLSHASTIGASLPSAR